MSKNGKKYDHDVGSGRTSEREKPEWRKSQLDRVKKYNAERAQTLQVAGNNPRPRVIDKEIKEASERVAKKKRAAKEKKKK